MDRAVTEKEATASCSNAFESKYLHCSAGFCLRNGMTVRS